MRIALVAPEWSRMVNSYPPLGLGYLAAVMEADGHEVAIIDLGLDPNAPLERGVERVVAFGPNLVGFTAMTNNYRSVEETVDLLRRRLQVPVVVGGPHATLFPEIILSHPGIAYVVCGEGEETLRELTRTILDAGPNPSRDRLQSVRGLAFKVNGRAVVNTPRPLIQDLDALPVPARHLFELERYPLYASDGERMVTLLSTRGCPYNCSYCFKGIVGRTYRQRSPENVLAEIRHVMTEYGYRHFYFVDDLFTLDSRRLEAIAARIIDEKLDIRWQCLGRVDRVTPELLKLMHRAGCRELHFGIESGDEEILRHVGKGFTLDQVRAAVLWAAQAGMLVKGYFMLGLPGDTELTMAKTLRLASELELDEAMFSLTTPFPGTRLWDEAVGQCPDLVEGRDLSTAYYYSGADPLGDTPGEAGAARPFLNVSAVSDARLLQLASEAQARFQEARRERKYVLRLGPVLGRALYAASRVRVLRGLGHELLRTPPLRRLRSLSGFADYDWRKVQAAKWR